MLSACAECSRPDGLFESQRPDDLPNDRGPDDSVPDRPELVQIRPKTNRGMASPAFDECLICGAVLCFRLKTASVLPHRDRSAVRKPAESLSWKPRKDRTP